MHTKDVNINAGAAGAKAGAESPVNGEKHLLGLFGAALREARQKAKVSQEALADKTRMDRSYISDIERGVGNATLLVMLKLSLALDIKLWELIKQVEDGRDSQTPGAENRSTTAGETSPVATENSCATTGENCQAPLPSHSHKL